MSRDSENVAIVRATIDAINRRDLDQAVDAAHEDFEADWSNSIAPHGGVHRGREQTRELFEAFFEAWDEWRWEPEEIIEVDEARGARQPRHPLDKDVLVSPEPRLETRCF